MTNRILHIIPGLDPGGAENILLQVVLALGAPEWEHHVLCLKHEGRLTAALRDAGARVQALNMDAGRPTLAGMLALGRLAKALRPFILRRTKDQVAKDLPAKTEQTVYCDLPPLLADGAWMAADLELP